MILLPSIVPKSHFLTGVLGTCKPSVYITVLFLNWQVDVDIATHIEIHDVGSARRYNV
jgi:hypothetical protein